MEGDLYLEGGGAYNCSMCGGVVIVSVVLMEMYLCCCVLVVQTLIGVKIMVLK